MTSALTKADLLTLHAVCHEAHPEIAHRISVEIAARSSVVEIGESVFEWCVPLSESRIALAGKHRGKKIVRHMAPLLNVFARMHPGQRHALDAALDARIMQALALWPKALLRNEPRRRAVIVTRYSSVRPDEMGVDLFAKAHVDRMVRAGILRGDTDADLERRADWKRVSPGDGRLLISVHELIAI